MLKSNDNSELKESENRSYIKMFLLIFLFLSVVLVLFLISRSCINKNKDCSSFSESNDSIYKRCAKEIGNGYIDNIVWDGAWKFEQFSDPDDGKVIASIYARSSGIKSLYQCVFYYDGDKINKYYVSYNDEVLYKDPSLKIGKYGIGQ